MEVGSNFLGIHDANRRRQQCIQRTLKFRSRQAGKRLEVRHLSQCVHTAVGPAGAVNHNLFLRNGAYGIVQQPLNCRKPRLDLPAVKIRAIVRNREFDVAHAQEWIIARVS